MSTRSSNNPNGFTRKPEADLYTVLLIFALLALLIGILYLHLEMKAYDYKVKDNTLPVSMAAENGGSPVAGHRALADNEKGFRVQDSGFGTPNFAV